jgi:hypothetical protein
MAVINHDHSLDEALSSLDETTSVVTTWRGPNPLKKKVSQRYPAGLRPCNSYLKQPIGWG